MSYHGSFFSKNKNCDANMIIPSSSGSYHNRNICQMNRNMIFITIPFTPRQIETDPPRGARSGPRPAGRCLARPGAGPPWWPASPGSAGPSPSSASGSAAPPGTRARSGPSSDAAAAWCPEPWCTWGAAGGKWPLTNEFRLTKHPHWHNRLIPEWDMWQLAGLASAQQANENITLISYQFKWRVYEEAYCEKDMRAIIQRLIYWMSFIQMRKTFKERVDLELVYFVAAKMESNFSFRALPSLRGQLDSSWWQKMTLFSTDLDTPRPEIISRSSSPHLEERLIFSPFLRGKAPCLGLCSGHWSQKKGLIKLILLRLNTMIQFNWKMCVCRWYFLGIL